MPNKQNVFMSDDERMEYVSKLELKYPVAAYSKRITRKRGEEATPETLQVEEGKEQTFIADKSLVSFVADVSAENRN